VKNKTGFLAHHTERCLAMRLLVYRKVFDKVAEQLARNQSGEKLNEKVL
jgi:hypothetical protein